MLGTQDRERAQQAAEEPSRQGQDRPDGRDLLFWFFVVFGIFANKRQHWAFIAGMILFGLDGMISLLIQDWLGLGFHAFALYCIFRGFAASREMNKA